MSSAAQDGDEVAEVPVSEPAEQPPAERVRRRPSTVGGAFYLLVLAATLGGIAVVSLGRWRLGLQWVAWALLAAAALRLVLPQREAGMLAVRNRLFDSTLLAAIGALLWFLAASIPDQPV